MNYGKLETINWILVFAFAIVVAVFAWYLLSNRKKIEEVENLHGTKDTRLLQLQAFERLTLLAERIKLEGLISRVYQPGYSASDMHITLIQSIRQEFEHNITQRIYVSPEIWAAVEKMKDQNMYIINQLASTLPAAATAMDLNKNILQFTMNHPASTMNNLLLEALQFEAKKVL